MEDRTPIELKRCPFCGGYAKLMSSSESLKINSHLCYWVVCRESDWKKCIKPTTSHYSKEMAIKLWNTRTHEPRKEFEGEPYWAFKNPIEGEPANFELAKPGTENIKVTVTVPKPTKCPIMEKWENE